MSLSVLPDELIEIIGSHIEVDDLLNLCIISPRLANMCKDDQFWRNLILYFHPSIINLDNFSLNQLIVLYGKIRQSGNLYILGEDLSGVLVLGLVTKPTKVFARNDVFQVSRVSEHGALVTADGQVYVFGNNDHSELGLGDTRRRNIPTPISGFSNVIQVSCGPDFTAFITDNGQLYTFGNNFYGQIGTSYGRDLTRPSLFNQLIDKKIVQVSCGPNHMGVVTSEGEAYVWGSGDNGQLGVESYNVESTSQPVLLDIKQKIEQLVCRLGTTALVTGQGDVYMYGWGVFSRLGNRSSLPQRVPNLPPIQQISLGAYHGLFLATTGEVYGYGDNSSNQLGVGADKIYYPIKIDHLPPIKQVAAGNFHSVFLTTQGEVYVCGDNNQGILGLDSEEKTISLPRQIPQISKVKQISAGYDYIAFIIS